MEDIIAVAVELVSGEQRYFLTWGRIQDKVDPQPVAALVLALSYRFALGGGVGVSAHVCGSLLEASTAPYFYEYFFMMCQQRIPFGRYSYPRWRRAMDAKMRDGKELYFLGNLVRSS